MSGEDAELLKQIAEYAGAINRYETRERRSVHLAKSSPYERPPSRIRHKSNNRNRTLVLAGQREPDECSAARGPSATWISSRDRGHLTLTNAAVYESTTATKLARIGESREARRKARLLKRDAREAERLKSLISATLSHDGITYKINRKANLLIRINLEDVVLRPTPTRAIIHGVEFVKSPKTENLYRKTTVKLIAKQKTKDRKRKSYCKYYTRSGSCHHRFMAMHEIADVPGVCTKAKECRYLHDDKHRALCSHYLTHHGCDESRLCNLSHEPVPENTPTCTHFLRSTCTKPDCKFVHVSVSQNAPVCPEFARNGYCAAGLQCGMRHARECPLYSNKGACTLKKCRLPHIARAGVTKQEMTTGERGEAEDQSDSESDSDYATDDYETEDFDETSFGEFVRL